jgi:DNA polymerase III subunit gamma/tau
MERAAPAVVAETPVSVQREPAHFPAASTTQAGYGATATLTEGALAKAPETSVVPSADLNVDSLRHAIGVALVSGGHNSAAQMLGTANWVLDSSSLRIEVPGVGKKMLSLVVNAIAEKIIRQELQRAGAPSRFMVVPGEGAAGGPASGAAPMVAAISGSVQEAALANPLVQRAKEIFKAEVRSVVDLRTK